MAIVHCTLHIVETFHQQKCFVFVIFNCNYPGESHVAATIWPCTYFLLLLLTSLVINMSGSAKMAWHLTPPNPTPFSSAHHSA